MSNAVFHNNVAGFVQQREELLAQRKMEYLEVNGNTQTESGKWTQDGDEYTLQASTGTPAQVFTLEEGMMVTVASGVTMYFEKD